MIPNSAGTWTALGSLVEPVAKIDPAQLGQQTIRYIDIGSVDGARHVILEAAEMKASTAPSRARQLVRAGDTIFSTVRPYLEKIALVDERLDSCIASTGFCVLRPRRDHVDSRFLFHYMTSRTLLGQVLPLQRGVSYPAVRNRDVLAATVPLPGFEEQLRIVKTLERHLARIDAAHRSLDHAMVLAGRMLDCAIAADPYLADASILSLAEVIARPLTNGRSVPTASEGFPVLRLTALRDGRVDLTARKIGAWTAEDASPFLVQEGDFLVSRGNGSIGLLARGGLVGKVHAPVAFPDTMIRIEPNIDVITSDYLALIWNSRLVRRQIEVMARTTAGIYKINQAQLRAVSLPVPKRSTQTKIVQRLTNAVVAIKRCTDAAFMLERRSEALRQSLLHAAFSDRLTVPSSDLDLAEELAAT